MTNSRRVTDEDLGRRLTAYAQARLSPSPAAAARMRARVMEAASAASAGATAATAAPAIAKEPIPFAAYRARLSGRSRTVAALMAAALSVLMLAGVAFASGPGSPLYGIRLWAETVALPSEPGARADYDVDRLEKRMNEAVGAANSGNGSGVAAALAAYRDILDDALSATAERESPSDRLEWALGRHRLVLTTLLDSVPDAARDAIERAIERSDEAARGIGNGNGNGNGNGDGNGNGNGGGKPTAHPTPHAPDGNGPSGKSRGGSERRPGSRSNEARPED
jgi:hypothetical protein